MRKILFGFAALLAGCGQPATPAPASTATPAINAAAPASQGATSGASSSQPIWFFCDGIDAPVIYLFADSPRDRRVRFLEYDKRTGATVRSFDLQTGEAEGAAGSVYTPLRSDGAEFGNVRQTNPSMLATPGAAYTLPYTNVTIGPQTVRCRWLPRTRVAGFTGRRSFVISEDADGDLIYTTYDFAHASTRPVDLSDNGQSTGFSVEVRNGQESVRADGSDFTFSGRDGFSYHIALRNDGAGQLQVLRNGAVVQNEPLTAYLQGQAEAGQL